MWDQSERSMKAEWTLSLHKRTLSRDCFYSTPTHSGSRRHGPTRSRQCRARRRPPAQGSGAASPGGRRLATESGTPLGASPWTQAQALDASQGAGWRGNAKVRMRRASSSPGPQRLRFP